MMLKTSCNVSDFALRPLTDVIERVLIIITQLIGDITFAQSEARAVYISKKQLRWKGIFILCRSS
jgi:hypothetical protein